MGWGVGSFLVQPQSRQEFHRLEYLPSVYYSDQIWPIFIFNPKPSNGLVPLNSTLNVGTLFSCGEEGRCCCLHSFLGLLQMNSVAHLKL